MSAPVYGLVVLYAICFSPLPLTFNLTVPAVLVLVNLIPIIVTLGYFIRKVLKDLQY